MKLDSYFSFMRGVPTIVGTNSMLFKDFCNEAEMEKNSQIVGFILTSSLNYIFLLYCPPTSNNAFVIWPSEQYFTVSISSANMF